MSYLTAPEASQFTAGTRDQLELFAAAHGHFSALHAAGWANEDLVELLSVISLSAYMDTLSLSLRIGPQAAPPPAN